MKRKQVLPKRHTGGFNELLWCQGPNMAFEGVIRIRSPGKGLHKAVAPAKGQKVKTTKRSWCPFCGGTVVGLLPAWILSFNQEHCPQNSADHKRGEKRKPRVLV